MKKQHQIKNQRYGNSQNLIFYLMLFFFASDGLKSGSVRETEWLSRQQATEDAVNITRICAESLMKNQS